MEEMPIRKLGATSLEVTPIGLGMAALGRPGYINLGHADDLQTNYNEAVMQRRAAEVAEEAWKLGIRYFDTARSYGKGEQFLGTWIEEHPEVTVGSKWGYTYTAAWQVEADQHEVKEHTLPVLERQWLESLESLGRKPELYQIHSATIESGVLDNAEVLNQLAYIKQEGTYIGLSLSGDRQAETLKRTQEISFDGVRLFDAVQATYNLLEPSAETALREAHDEGMGIIVKEALANGRLTARNNNPEDAKMIGRLSEIAQTLSCTMDALALAVITTRPWVDIALSGAASVEQIKSNVRAMGIAVDDELYQEMRNQFAEPASAYWLKRKNMAWN
ncbi:MAG: aldo/keto reductase [Bacteroidota bacterium]